MQGKFYKFLQDAGKFLQNFPCRVPEVSKLSKMIHACMPAHEKNSCNLNPGHPYSTNYTWKWRLFLLALFLKATGTVILGKQKV